MSSNPPAKQQSYSLKRQLNQFVICFISLIAVACMLVSAWVAVSQSSRNLQQHSLQVAANLAELSVLPLLTRSVKNAEQAINQVLGFGDIVGISIYNTTFTPLIQHGEPINASQQLVPLFSISSPTVIDETREHWLISAPVSLKQDADLIPELSLDSVNRQLLGYAVIKVSKASLLELLKQTLLYSFITACLFTLVMTLLMQRVLQRLTFPLYNLSRTMKQAHTSGEYPCARVEGPKEVQRMAVSFNEMMDVLKQQEQQLLTLNAGLESEVEMRTEELRHARDAALVAVRTQSEFLANISHELRTPLQANIGYIELVREELAFDGKTEQTADLDEALTSAQRLLVMINVILDLAKCESGKMDLREQPVSVLQLIDEVESIIRPMSLKNSNTLQIDRPPENFILRLDKEKVEQILINLLSNACKFTENGNITLKCQVQDQQLIWEVSDTGIGIHEAQQQVIFEKFRQADGSIKRRFEGTGLGLAISQHFAELMGGKIECQSRPGKGSVFTFTQPLRSAD